MLAAGLVSLAVFAIASLFSSGAMAMQTTCVRAMPNQLTISNRNAQLKKDTQITLKHDKVDPGDHVYKAERNAMAFVMNRKIAVQLGGKREERWYYLFGNDICDHVQVADPLTVTVQELEYVH